MKHRAAFSLVELVIVVLIIGIMSAVAVPKFHGTISRFRVEAAAKRIAADLTLARNEAKANGAIQPVDFSVASNDYQLPGIADLDHPSQTYTVALANTGYAAILVSADFDSDESISFNKYGRPYSGSPPASPLVNGTIIVESAGYQKTIQVDAVTGKAKVL